MAASEDRMDKDEARGFLESLLNKKLRIHTTDERMFWGEFKCTDPVGYTSSLVQLATGSGEVNWLTCLRIEI